MHKISLTVRCIADGTETLFDPKTLLIMKIIQALNDAVELLDCVSMRF